MVASKKTVIPSESGNKSVAMSNRKNDGTLRPEELYIRKPKE